MNINEKKLNTALIIGRWQPWHKGHRELFKAALDRAEKVAIGVRATFETDGKNPMQAKVLAKLFSQDHNIQIIKNPEKAIEQELMNLQKIDGMAILGTHCLGPAISKKFNISFDTI